MTDHPELWAGLSPRVRGSLLTRVSGHQIGGSIPACAGEPSSSVSISSYCWVYPRVCGGALIQRIYLIVLLGLSPRVRGSPK